jgi:hypothetical protein
VRITWEIVEISPKLVKMANHATGTEKFTPHRSPKRKPVITFLIEGEHSNKLLLHAKEAQFPGR